MPWVGSHDQGGAGVKGHWVTVDPGTASKRQHDVFQLALDSLANVPSEDEQDELARMLRVVAKED